MGFNLKRSSTVAQQYSGVKFRIQETGVKRLVGVNSGRKGPRNAKRKMEIFHEEGTPGFARQARERGKNGHSVHSATPEF
jgi:hypothetical protein